MTRLDTLVEQQILEYQARFKHLDELLEQAEKGPAGGEKVAVVGNELAELRQERQKLIDDIEDIKKKTKEEWQEDTIEEAGPMVLWEAVAKRIENLIERLEK